MKKYCLLLFYIILLTSCNQDIGNTSIESLTNHIFSTIETVQTETEPSETLLSEIELQETLPPETELQETLPPETELQETQPPETEPRETQPPETEPLETQPPETEPLETQPLETDPAEPDVLENLPYTNIEYNYITTDYFTYALVDNTALVVQEYIGPKGIIVMQPVLDGYAVSGILPDAFADDTGVQVCVTDSVTYVAETAFPADISGVYYADTALRAKAIGDMSLFRDTEIFWDWETIACVPWKNSEEDRELFLAHPSTLDPLHPNRVVAAEATTLIYCERSPEKDFVYTIENGEVTVHSYTGSFPYVSIPSMIEGYPVTKLGYNSFDGCQMIHLEVPGSITYIDHFTACLQTVIVTVHILDGADCVVGENVFIAGVNHLRVHDNIVGEVPYEGDPADTPTNGMQFINARTLVEEGSAEKNKFLMHGSAFFYPDQEE